MNIIRVDLTEEPIDMRLPGLVVVEHADRQ